MPFRKTKGAQKPPAGGQVDWGDPINVGLVGCWPFNEGGGNNVYDIAGLHHGVLTSGPTWQGGAVKFDGTDDYITCPTVSIPTDVTASAWIYSTSLGQSGFIISKSPVNSTWELFLDFSGTALIWRVGTTNALTATQPSANRWHHVAGTQQGTTGALYIDGVQVASGTMNAIVNGTGAILIGAYGTGAGMYNYVGRMEMLRLHKRSLQPSEIARLYSEKYAGLVAPRRRIISQVAGGAAAVVGSYYYREVAGMSGGM